MARKTQKTVREKVYKKIDLVGVSTESFEEAIRSAVQRAGETVQDLCWFEVKEMRGAVRKNQVLEFQVVLCIGFEVH